jgi:hypothetical protein
MFLFFIHNRVFGADTLFIRTKNTVGAQSAQFAPGATMAHIAGYVELQRQSLRGRRPVRANHRLRTDDDPRPHPIGDLE